MREQLEALRDEALTLVDQATTQKDLNDVRVKYLGKKGPITEVLRGMGKLSAEERPVVGEIANTVGQAIQE
jgi:phenylalanyl-tRNA synthetase alpha chain